MFFPWTSGLTHWWTGNSKVPKLQLRFSFSFQWVNKQPVQHLCIFLHIKRCYNGVLNTNYSQCYMRVCLRRCWRKITCMIFIDRQHALQKSGCWDLFLLRTRVCKKASYQLSTTIFGYKSVLRLSKRLAAVKLMTRIVLQGLSYSGLFTYCLLQ